ncbi:unnamed protein product, partial [Amoebophrya sp. A120]|eukprot:GSA120T00021881001.1
MSEGGGEVQLPRDGMRGGLTTHDKGSPNKNIVQDVFNHINYIVDETSLLRFHLDATIFPSKNATDTCIGTIGSSFAIAVVATFSGYWILRARKVAE